MHTGIVITVRYAGPTNFRDARWIATADHSIGRIVVPYAHEINGGLENARTAADAMVARWAADDEARWGSGISPRVIVAAGHTVHGYAFIVSHRECNAAD